jgi:hypothetical protein
MNPSQLTETERESFDRAMTTIDGMSDDDRRALLAYSVAASIRYATKRDGETLAQWCAGLLRTIRIHADPEYRAARDGRSKPDRSRPPIRLSERLSGLVR